MDRKETNITTEQWSLLNVNISKFHFLLLQEGGILNLPYTHITNSLFLYGFKLE